MKVNKKSAIGVGALIAGSMVLLGGCAGGSTDGGDSGGDGDGGGGD